MGINVTAYINQLGYGIAGLNIVKALTRAGQEPALWVNGPGQAPTEDHKVMEEAVARTVSFNPDAPSLRIAHQWDFAHRVGRGKHMGLTFFELNRLLSNEVHHLCSLDVVFSPSEWGAKVMMDCGVPAEKVAWAPLGVDRTIFHPDVEPAIVVGEESYLPAKAMNVTVFLSCGKWEVRKGHDVLAEAFSRAFLPSDNVLLIMNCSNPFLAPAQTLEWEQLYANSPMAGRTLVLHDRMASQQEVARLMATADCGVFPARAEGWNLELLEMMSMGKTVIATDYSAHTEFCHEENARLIQVAGLEPAYDGVFFNGQHGEWAEMGEAQIEQLVEHMRAVHREKQAGELERNDVGILTADWLSWDHTVSEILGSLS